MKRVSEGQGDAVPQRYPPVIPREAEKLQLAACAGPLLLDAATAWGKWQERRDGQGVRCDWGKALPGPAQGQGTQQPRCVTVQTSSHLDDGVADTPSLLAEHRVLEGLVHYNIGYFLQVHITGVCREEKYCKDLALFGP